MTVMRALLSLLLPALTVGAADAAYRIEVSTVLTGRGKQLYTQSRAAIIPGNPVRVILTTQETDPTGAHGYKDMFMVETLDLGRTWSAPAPIASLRRARMPEGHDFVIGDVCPQWHAATGRVLATGKTFGFRGGTTEDRGFERVLCEGGPSLLSDLVRSGELDELCLTWSPLVTGGEAIRILDGGQVDVRFELGHLLHSRGTLLGRWVVSGST